MTEGGADNPVEVTTTFRRVNNDAVAAWLAWPLEDKTCGDCFRKLSIKCFHVHTRWPCGLPRLWVTYCNDCLRERTRFYARQRRRRQGVPERPGGPYRIRGGHHESGYRDKVPIEPFVQWLRVKTAQLDAERAYFNDPGEVPIKSGIEQLAEAAQVDLERLRKIKNSKLTGKHSQKHVTLGFVDRVLIASGTSTGLWELYPDD